MSGDCAVSFRLDNGDMVGPSADVSSGLDASFTSTCRVSVVVSFMLECRVSVAKSAANAGMTFPNSLVRSASCELSLCHFPIPMGELVVRLLSFKISLRMLASLTLRAALILANSSRISAAL